MSVRLFQTTDLEALLEINQACLPAVNSLTLSELGDLIGKSVVTLVGEVDDAPAGFVLCLNEETDYSSRNFQWLKALLSRFFYVDRVALSPAARGKGLGRALYCALLMHLRERSIDPSLQLTCEVNERPPNPVSLRFHESLGFAAIGRQNLGDKAVVYLARPLTQPVAERVRVR